MDDDRILPAHGGGGALMRELLDAVIAPALGNAEATLADAAPVPGVEDVLVTTDSFVVKPLFFHGGDIGSLSVYGAVNDLAVAGAKPLAVTLSVIAEEGLPIGVLRRVVQSAADAARKCGVAVVAGDTKVVGRGEADELFVTTAGIGKRVLDVDPRRLRDGDGILVSGSIGEHGIAVMSLREGIAFDTHIQSDAASVWPLVAALRDAGIDVHAMRDPTRGGVAAACVELADASNVSIRLEETGIPVRPDVRLACEMLGLDPLTVANEGKLIASVAEADVSRAVDCLRKIPGGENASVMGRVMRRGAMAVSLRTRYGGERVVEMPYGEELPRIC